MLNGLKEWFYGDGKVATAKERIADLKRLQAQGDLSKKHRAHLEAAEKIVVDGRRNFALRAAAVVTVASGGVWGAVKLAEEEDDLKKEKVPEAANRQVDEDSAENREGSPERSLDSFIMNFETAFLDLCYELRSKELPMRAKIKIKRLQEMVVNNASNAPDGRNYKRHKKNAGASAEPLHSEYFYYNTEDTFQAAGYAFHAALQRMIQFGPDFDYNNRFDMLSALHELEHADQDIERRVKIDPLSGGYSNYLERYTPKPGVESVVGLDDEIEAYSLHTEALNVLIDGDLAEASKAGYLNDIEKLVDEYLATKPQNFTSEQEQAGYINGLYEFLLDRMENPDILNKIKEGAHVVTYRQVTAFLPLLIFSSHYFRDYFRATDYLKRFYEKQGIVMYENNPDGSFRKME